MPEQEHLRRPVAERTTEEAEAAATSTPSGTGERLKAELEDLLDEIDEVLETNAEDFVRSFVQKGGE
jgi:prokaryotic ubiquitin-like protein Pup